MKHVDADLDLDSTQRRCRCSGHEQLVVEHVRFGHWGQDSSSRSRVPWRMDICGIMQRSVEGA